MDNKLFDLDDRVKASIHIAQSFAKEYTNDTYTASHLLKALFHKEIGIREYVEALGKDAGYMEEWAEVRIEECPRSGKVTEVKPDRAIGAIFEQADFIRLKLGLQQINPICVLAAIAQPGIAFSQNQLKSFPFRENEILDQFIDKQDVCTAIHNESEHPAGTSKRGDAALYKYCVDKTQEAREGKISPIICRETETRMMIEILGRKAKANVIITGDSGVGKTALIDGLAWDIVNKRVPSFLDEATIFELDMGAMIAGASYKGEVEDRLKKVIKDIREVDRAILFIDEIHTLLDSKQGNNGVSSILKSELAKGDLTVIGATTADEYRKLIEPDQAFVRRFEELKINEPDLASAIKMVRFMLGIYTEYHGLKVSQDAIPECVRLAKRYVKDRRLPDSAIDLIDRTLSAVKLVNETANTDIQEYKNSLSSIEVELKSNEEEAAYEHLKGVYSSMQNHLSPVLLGMIADEVSPDGWDKAESFLEYLKHKIALLEDFASKPIEEVGAQEVTSIVANKTGIPLGKLQTHEKDRLLNMEEILRNRVVGQDKALKSLSDAILESRSGLNKPGQPIGSFFFLGPTGTGKTELAKALAEALFNDEKAMIRFDMSEFKEEHSAALLYGAPPGYVGYEEGGLLVNKIRRQPYSVVLFDEIEKAHSSVYDIFLQIMDEGKLHDRLGKEGDFSNSIILFTSNIGSSWLSEQLAQGNTPTTTQMMEVMGNYFRPEFLARLSEIVPFSPIGENILMKIFEIQMRSVTDLLNKQGIAIQLEDEVKKMLAFKGFDPKYGARQVAGVIRNYLRRPISRLIIRGDLSSGCLLKVGLDDKSELTWNIGVMSLEDKTSK